MAVHRRTDAKWNRFTAGRSAFVRFVAGLVVLTGTTGWAGATQAAVGGERGVREVPCRAGELSAAVSRLDAGRRATLQLAAACTYTLDLSSTATGGTPTVTGHLTIVGNGATVIGSGAATPGCSGVLRVAPVAASIWSTPP